MYYSIKFPDKDNMWNFIDFKLSGNYSANNTTATVEIHERHYPKIQTLEKAKQYGGKLVEAVQSE